MKYIHKEIVIPMRVRGTVWVDGLHALKSETLEVRDAAVEFRVLGN